jgi:acyl-CoA synthetase (AMP-forming)/AMP-acid ligase II
MEHPHPRSLCTPILSMEFLETHVVAEIPRFHAARRPDAMALTFEDRIVTFRELDAASSAIAQGLIAAGLEPGARIATFAKDSHETFELLFGIGKARGVVTGINWRLAAREVRYILEDGEVEALFVDAERVPMIAAMRADLPWLKLIVVLGDQPAPELGPNFAAWLAAQNPADPKLSLDREDVYAQLYTSGTTGNPKGVRLANRSFFAILASMRAVGDPWIGWTPDDIALHNVPTFHIAGLWWAMTALSNGAGGVIMPEFVPKEVHRLVPKFRVTKACLVPAMIQMTLAEPGVEDVDWDSLGHIVYGGSPIPKVLLKRSLEVFECGLAQIYGLTETGNTAVCLRPEDHAEDELLMAAGRPYPGVQMKIIDEAGNELGPGQIGEVCLHSPANMVEYWHLPEATAKTLIDGWIHTGDAGYTNERGYLFVCDRIKDMILCAAENIYPAEIESVLTAFPGVLEVAVIGIPDERWGESVHAILVPKPGADPIRKRALLAHCREHLADFKVPTSIEIRTENLPRTPSGKIKKTILRKPYWEGRDRQV